MQIRQNGPFERWQIVSPVESWLCCNRVRLFFFSLFCFYVRRVLLCACVVGVRGVLWRVGVAAAVCVCPAALGDASRAAFSVYIHFDPLDAPARRLSLIHI